MPGKHSRSLRCAGLLIFSAPAGTALLLILAAALLIPHFLGKINYVSPEAEPVLSTQPSLPLSGDSSEFASSEPQQCHTDRFNLLLIGQDTRQPGTRARSDAMILCSFLEERKQLTMISFLRDLYVPIPGHGSNRLNAAYALGGMPLLKQTFTENFGIPIDGCIEVDFDGFSQLVDLLGGVSIELRPDEAAAISSPEAPVSEGLQQLSGTQALHYARIRNLDADGDFSRTHRQRKLLSAMLESCQSCSTGTLLTLLNSALPLLTTDLSPRQILCYAAQILPAAPELETVCMRIPADGTYEPATVDGMSVLIADPEKTRELLRDVFTSE